MLASCATKQNYIILNFSDFGPLSLSRDLLGNDWWQWQRHGDSKPRVYNIKENVQLKLRFRLTLNSCAPLILYVD